ncbi:hypothetical protein [Hydrogenothermus marinus]|uniref:Uncharacterized protein n=1 Tax=Hydrogenothermus marinus TaxID=133270 RepID=A0A3M0BK13_9AQUI|nr:hypothetical protein [Hydrogenothermus marinus]RMA97670.1 hypothetical protein CLV39_0290 [Hydrogenothermus marinus]
MEVLNTIFLGIIAFCMLFITIGIVVALFMLSNILKILKDLLLEVKTDYKAVSPKVRRVIENLEFTTSIVGLLSLFKRKKRGEK